MKSVTRTATAVLVLFPAYAVFAYVVMPVSWRQYHRLAGFPRAVGVTRTAEGLSADPLNVAFVGSPADVAAAMHDAGWSRADRISIRSGLRDATSVVFHRPYASAPVSTHVLWGRPQDLAFEQTVGGSPRQRHHVRLWRVNDPADPRDTVWVGAACYDRSVGLSPYTGEVVHHTETRVDAERDKLVADLDRAGRLTRIDRVEGWREAGRGLNGSGDPYVTDGSICVAVLGPVSASRIALPAPDEILQVLKAAIFGPADPEAAS
jgi:LssY C-terminus